MLALIHGSELDPASLLVLCSRLTAGNNERATQRRDNEASDYNDGKEESFIAPLLLSSSSTRVPIVVLTELLYNIRGKHWKHETQAPTFFE